LDGLAVGKSVFASIMTLPEAEVWTASIAVTITDTNTQTNANQSERRVELSRVGNTSAQTPAKGRRYKALHGARPAQYHNLRNYPLRP